MILFGGNRVVDLTDKKVLMELLYPYRTLLYIPLKNQQITGLKLELEYAYLLDDSRLPFFFVNVNNGPRKYIIVRTVLPYPKEAHRGEFDAFRKEVLPAVTDTLLRINSAIEQGSYRLELENALNGLSLGIKSFSISDEKGLEEKLI